MPQAHPDFTHIANSYHLEWADLNIKISISNLSESYGSIYGEVVVSLAESKQHIYHARVNLVSAQGKKGLVDALSKRASLEDGYDWYKLVEQAILLTLREFRKGAPTIKVGDLPRREAAKFRVRPLILEGGLNALYAYGGSGKSTLACLLALMVQCGVDAIGMEAVKGNALLLDWESSPESIDEIVKALKIGMSIESDELPFYRRCSRILTAEIGEVQKQVLENDIDFVVIDSAGMAAGLSKDFHAPALDMMMAARTLNCTVLLIDHKPKDGDSMFGSVYKFNECRAAWEVKATQDEGASFLDMALFHTKHNVTRRFPPIGFRVDFDGDDDFTDAITFSRQDVASMPDIESSLSASVRILNLIKDEQLAPKEISEALGIKLGTVNVNLTRLKHKDTITKLSDGRYGLSYKE